MPFRTKAGQTRSDDSGSEDEGGGWGAHESLRANVKVGRAKREGASHM